MVQNEICNSSYTTQHTLSPNKKPMKSVNFSKTSAELVRPENVQDTTNQVSPCVEKKSEILKTDKVEPRTVINAVEGIKKRRREELLAKQKQAEEEREIFVKAALERKAAEREEVIKQAKLLIMYRKPMSRKINQGLLASECLRELDEQMKFREMIKEINKEEEMNYVNSLKADVAKYEEERKQKAKEQLEKRKIYTDELKKQIDENERNTREKEKEEYEAEKEDQTNISTYLQELKEHEQKELLNKKQKLRQIFEDAIEEKKRFDLKLKYEEKFEDRAIEMYQKSKDRIKKMHKSVALRDKEEKELKSKIAREKYCKFVQLTENKEEEWFKKALEEKETIQNEKERQQKEKKNKIRKELQEIQKETMIAKSKQLEENRNWKTWEMMQRFKKDEYDKMLEAEERKREWSKKVEYGNELKKYIGEKETEMKQERILEEKTIEINTKQIIENENQKLLDYAEKVVQESKGVRPLYPILKAIKECKKEMGLLPLKNEESEYVGNERPKRRRAVRQVCTKYIPEHKICYL